MIINPYTFKTSDKESKKENNFKEQLSENELINKISDLLLREYQVQVEEGKEEKIKDIVIKELECNYLLKDVTTKNKIVSEVINKIYGYGILQKYIDDIHISDIRVVSYNNIYIKKDGVWEKVQDKFENAEEFDSYIRFCAIKNNSAINTENPICVFSDRKNSLRIEAGIMPANIENSNLVIRIHRKNIETTLESLLLKTDMLNVGIYKYLMSEIQQRKSFVICGKGGSGKTTLLKALVNALPEEVPITTSEETAEMFFKNRNIIQRECILNRAQDSLIDLEKLTKHTLVMSNDVIVLGELKGAEANTFFDALATGHMGLATVHTDSAALVIDRLITLIKKDVKAQYYTEDFLRKLLSSSIDNVIYMQDFKICNVSKLVDKKSLNFEVIYDISQGD